MSFQYNENLKISLKKQLGMLAITTTHPHSKESKFRFCAGSSFDPGVS